MKRYLSIPLALSLFLAASACLTSCEEEAPEINYSLSVTVVNDFSAIVEAIENGTLKNEQAIDRLTAAIDRMNTDQSTKLQAVIDIVTSLNTSLKTKLTSLEAAMRTQTLSLERKLDLLTASIAALPDYGAKLDAIRTAIAALPDYNTRLAAVVTALNAIKTQVGALGTAQNHIVMAVENVRAAINALAAEVDAGQTSSAAAITQIVAQLEGLKDMIVDMSAPASNTITIDGVRRPIWKVGIDKSDLVGDLNYDIYFFLSDTEYVEVMANGSLHDGYPIDLSVKETTHSGWYWMVEYRINGSRKFGAFGNPGSGRPVFLTGTLFVQHVGPTPTPNFVVKLENGRVMDDDSGDGQEYTISIDYSGLMFFDEY